MSKCLCFKCEAVNKLPTFKDDELCIDGFSATCPACNSVNIEFSVDVNDLNQVPFSIRTKMLAAMHG